MLKPGAVAHCGEEGTGESHVIDRMRAQGWRCFQEAPLLPPRSCDSGRRDQALGLGRWGEPTDQCPLKTHTTCSLCKSLSSSPPPPLDTLKTWHWGEGLCSPGTRMVPGTHGLLCLTNGHREENDAQKNRDTGQRFAGGGETGCRRLREIPAQGLARSHRLLPLLSTPPAHQCQSATLPAGGSTAAA